MRADHYDWNERNGSDPMIFLYRIIDARVGFQKVTYTRSADCGDCENAQNEKPHCSKGCKNDCLRTVVCKDAGSAQQWKLMTNGPKQLIGEWACECSLNATCRVIDDSRGFAVEDNEGNRYRCHQTAARKRR